jgi:hypothetical protein
MLECNLIPDSILVFKYNLVHMVKICFFTTYAVFHKYLFIYSLFIFSFAGEVKIRNTIHVKSSDKEVEVYRRTRFVVLCIVCLHICVLHVAGCVLCVLSVIIFLNF